MYKKYNLVEDNITYFIVCEYFYDKKLKIINYYLDDKHTNLQRNNRPAIIVCDYEINKIIREEYYCNNKLHRESGPAIIQYAFVKKPRKEYWLNGKELNSIKSTKKLKEYIESLKC